MPMEMRPELTLYPAYHYEGLVYCAACVPNPRDRAPYGIRYGQCWFGEDYPTCVTCGQVHRHVELVLEEDDEYDDEPEYEDEPEYDEYEEDSEQEEDDIGIRMKEAGDY